MQRVVCPRPQSSGAIKIRLAGWTDKKEYFYKSRLTTPYVQTGDPIFLIDTDGTYFAGTKL
jgi:hypothetical protein